jgi:hypothetical protein
MSFAFVVGDRALSGEDTHPLWMAAYAMADDYLVVGASAVGQMHLARGRPRDDAFAVRAHSPWVVVAVSDGVGSRPLSRYGSAYVTDVLSALLLRALKPAVPDPEAAAALPTQRPKLAPSPDLPSIRFPQSSASKRAAVSAPIFGKIINWLSASFRTVGGPIEEATSPKSLPPLYQAASIAWQPSQPFADAHNRAVTGPPVYQEQESETQSPITAPVNLHEVMRQAFQKTHHGLREHALSLGLTLSDLACTALALILNVETGEVAAAQVGDGAVLGLTAEGSVVKLVHGEQTGDSQSTYTLNGPDFEQHLAITSMARRQDDPFMALYVMTDGVSGDLLYSPMQDMLTEWARKVDSNLHNAPTPAQAAGGMLNWLATYEVPGSWDDRTLVVITRKGGRAHGDSHNQSGASSSAQTAEGR